jgi:hypothetical protein
MLLTVPIAHAEPVRVRYAEAPARGFLVLMSEDGGTPLAHGELEQWMKGTVAVSRLVFQFVDGSVYDETVQFSQRRVFRVESYRLQQHGPSFSETVDVSFDRTGRYRARRRAAPGEPEQEASGDVELPNDVMNGMTSVTCKNVMPDGAATVHIVTFQPEPRVIELRVTADGTDRFSVGPLPRTATRFLVRPHVTGVMGALATVTGKQPPDLRMWIARGRAPLLVRFEGPMYADGPTWRIAPTGPRWDR